MPDQELKTPEEWQDGEMYVIQDPHGWADGSDMGAKDFTAPISHAEFLVRAASSSLAPASTLRG